MQACVLARDERPFWEVVTCESPERIGEKGAKLGWD